MAGSANPTSFTSSQYRQKIREFAELFGFTTKEVMGLFEWAALMLRYELKLPQAAAEESAYSLIESVYTINQDEPS